MLSENDCKSILQKLDLENATFKNFKIVPLSEETEGFMGDHFKVIIEYVENNSVKTSQFFMKTKPKTTKANEIVQGMGMFKREIFVYEILLKEFEKYGYATDFASASYLSLNESALVLEDLSLLGYSITERHEAFSLEHVQCALDALAAYHGAGFAYEYTRSMEGGVDPTVLKSVSARYSLAQHYPEFFEESFYVQFINKNAFGMNWWTGLRKTILKLISLLGDDPRFVNFESLYNNYDFGKIFAQNLGINKTSSHGDLWSNNLMFKYENNVPVKCRLLDFQLTRYFYPCFDVLLAIFSNTDAEFRQKHLQDLYKYYFDTLGRILRKYNCQIEDIHPWEHFLHTIDICMPDALCQIILVYCIINLPVSFVTNLATEALQDLMFHNAEIVAEAFEKDEVYRKKLLEVLTYFYDVLTKANSESS